MTISLENIRRAILRRLSHRAASRRSICRKPQIQSLESRKLFATLMNASRMTYQDVDGDTVEVSFSSPILTPAKVNSVFTFNSGSVNGNNGSPQQLTSINLDAVRSSGVSMSVLVTQKATDGDGLANVGQVMTKNDLGSLHILGDLGRIVAGNTFVLHATSIGKLGLRTGAESLQTRINGNVGALYADEIQNADIQVTGNIDTYRGKFLIGGKSLNAGRVYAGNAINSAMIDNILGGSGEASGQVAAGKLLQQVTTSNMVLGGSGLGSGSIVSYGNISNFFSYGDIVGGDGSLSGSVVAFGHSIENAYIRGSLIGGNGANSGTINGDIQILEITKNIQGGKGEGSGSLSAGTILKVTMDGNLVGGQGNRSGQIRASQSIETIEVFGTVFGSSGYQSGAIVNTGVQTSILYSENASSDIHLVFIHNNLFGGKGLQSGVILSNNSIHFVRVDGTVFGGQGAYSGGISAGKSLFELEVGADVNGGLGDRSGFVEAKRGDLFLVNIHGALIGGLGNKDTGIISGDFGIDQITIDGSVVGKGVQSAQVISPEGFIGKVVVGGNLMGGLSHSGIIQAHSNLDDVTIQKNLMGGNAIGSDTVEWSGAIVGGIVTRIHVGGAIVSGTELPGAHVRKSGIIRANFYIDTLIVDGPILGNSDNPALISVYGQLGRMLVNDYIVWTNIIVGESYDPDIPNFADASVGAVVVHGDWIRSNLTVGVAADPSGDYGTGDNHKYTGYVVDEPAKHSTIGSVVISGNVYGTLNNTHDHFGIVAERISKVSINGKSISLKPGISNDEVDYLRDFAILEITH